MDDDKFELKFGGRFSLDLEGLNISEIHEILTDMECGMLVEVQNVEGNEQV